jgi:hypothetical protein
MSKLQKANHRLAFSLSFLSLSTILILRTFLGVDLSDEMQYYGQIFSLIETNKIFINDLFFQQLVYVPFYPVLKIYHGLFGTIGLVLITRLLLSLIILFVFVFTYIKLKKISSNEIISALTALALTFAITFNGIFFY